MVALEQLAESLAVQAHADNPPDPDGRPHIEHVRRVAAACSGDARVVAFLHDVLEDSEMTPAELETHGIPRRLVELVIVLSRGAGEPYEAYLGRVEHASPEARAVKIADINDNLRRSEQAGDARRIRKYRAALARLARDADSGPVGGEGLEPASEPRASSRGRQKTCS